VAAACALAARAPAQQPGNPPPPVPQPDAQKQLDQVLRENAEMKKAIQDLKQKVDGSPPPAAQPGTPPAQPGAQPSSQDALDRALAESAPTPGRPSATGDLASFKLGSATVKLIDVSFVADLAVGWSSENDASLQTLQGGGHDPRKRGFTLQAAELGISGAVDPYFNAQANIAYFIDPQSGESVVELEEAFATTTSLPYGLQVKAGQYLTEFGILNGTHPHAWDWLDQPVIMSRLLSGDGMRAPGARIGWLLPVPWYSQLIAGVQNGNGEQMVSFLANEETFSDRGIGGRPFGDPQVSGFGDLVYSGRWENSVDLSKETTIKFGVSEAVGPNGSGAGENTRLYGADFKLKWKASSNERGWPFVIWQSEIMARDYDAAAVPAAGLPETTLHDWGFYTQALYGFTPGWAAGIRYEYATGSGESVGGRENDPFRDNRQRISPVLIWNLSEFSRLRLQYNHDIADHLASGHADSLYFGLEVLFGAHPAHTY
jgi:hypothetical protein